MALNIYKTFTREKLTYQNLNALQQHFADYINNYVLLAADCVSANTPNKVVKRDASGNFAAGTITANLVGNVTGNLTGNVTGNLTGNANTSTNVTTYINGMAISSIFESDKTTVKRATSATSATSANNGVPVGTVFPYAGPSAPTGYLLCYGQAVSRTTYSALFAVIGTTYGAGNGSTTFNVPDMRGRVGIGLDNMGGISANRVTVAAADVLGGSGGEEKHALTESENGTHFHRERYINTEGTLLDGISYTSGGGYLGGGPGGVTLVKDQNPVAVNTGSSGSGTPHNNMQPWLGLNYIIKY